MTGIIKKALSKSMYKDFVLNIAASVIYTVSTQFIAYPFLSRVVTSAEYGLILTLMGVANAIGVSVGNPLNNTKIILQKEYDDPLTAGIGKAKGDFNLMFVFGALFNLIFVSVLSYVVLGEFSPVIPGLMVISLLVLFRAYYTVTFRLVINYRKYLYSSIFSLAGYLFGALVTGMAKQSMPGASWTWIFVFVFGELFACIFIYFNAGNLFAEKLTAGPLFNTALKKYLFIMSAAVLSTLMIYMDRFFIFPFLGAEQVSVYNVSSFLGKTAGIIMSPISGVLLTYYAKESRLTLKQFAGRMGIFLMFSALFYGGILVAGVRVTGLLYPTIIESTLPFFRIANLATTIFILGNTIQPTLIRFCNVKWQPVVQVIYLIIYLTAGIYGMKYHGLMGFCYAVLAANVVKVLLMTAIVVLTIKGKPKTGIKSDGPADPDTIEDRKVIEVISE